MSGIFDDILGDAGTAAGLVMPDSVRQTVESDQRSKEWFMQRLGNFTHSRVGDLMTAGRGSKFGETAIKYVTQIAIERTLSDAGREMYVEQMMARDFVQTRWGNKYEDEALQRYSDGLFEALKPSLKKSGFIKSEKIENFGGSVDFMLGDIPGEIKCPFDPIVHENNISLVKTGIDKSHKYYPQFQAHILDSFADYCIFISYDPRRDNEKQLAVITVERDADYIAKMVDRLNIANDAINEYLSSGTPISVTLNY